MKLSAQPIIGTVAGNHQRSTSHRLAGLARPVVDAHVDDRRRAVCRQLEAAVGSRRAASGIHEVWRAAEDRSIQLLLVDPTLVYPARPAPDGRSLTPTIDRTGPDVLDDAVDEIIEAVAQHGGRTCFSALDPVHGGIAAVLTTT